jgi:cis-L-3-hydroxyproline dehydratase
VTRRQVSAIELPRTGGPEPLARIISRPQVEIDDLWAIDRGEPDDLAGGDVEGVTGANRYDEVADGTTTIVLRRQSSDQVAVRSQRTVANSDIRGVGHLGSMSYALCSASRPPEVASWSRVTVPAMRITSIEAYTYELGYRYGTYVMSGGRVVNTLTSTVVRIVTDEDIDGWAETCPLGSTYLPAHARGAIPALHELAPALIGADPANLADVNKRMREALMGHNYAKSPLDVACWDIYGKAVGRPVVDLIGGRLADDMPLYKAVPLGDAESMVAFTLEQRSHGIHHFQLKVGNDPRADARASLAVVEATDDDDLILADANGGWRRQDAVVAARIMDGAERLYLEQPCPTLAECLLVRRNTTIPFVLDEVITDVAALVEAAQAGGMEAINLKLNRVGGLTNAKLVRDVAVELGIRLTIEDSWGGDLTSAAVSHLGASTPPHALFAVSFMNDWTDNHLAGYQPRSVDGRGAAPTTPGLGVTVDLNILGAPVATWS